MNNGFVIYVAPPLSISCSAGRSTQQPAGNASWVRCSVSNSGDVADLNTTLALSAGGPVASQSIGRLEKGSVTATFDPIPSIYQSMTGTVTWNASGQTFSIGTTFPVDQCLSRFSVSPASALVGINGTTGSIAVSAPPGCAWTAVNSTSNPDLVEWIQFTGPFSGVGRGTLVYTVLSHGAAAARTGS